MVKSGEIYAGFWIRAVALFIDSVLLVVPLSVVSYFLFPETMNPETISAKPEVLMLSFAFQQFCAFLYFGVLQTFLHGSPGKRLVGLKIVSMDLSPMGFGRGIGRYFGSWVSSIFMGIGYIWAGFSEKKQGWHDLMVGTVVVKEKFLQKSNSIPEGGKIAA